MKMESAVAAIRRSPQSRHRASPKRSSQRSRQYPKAISSRLRFLAQKADDNHAAVSEPKQILDDCLKLGSVDP